MGAAPYNGNASIKSWLGGKSFGFEAGLSGEPERAFFLAAEHRRASLMSPAAPGEDGRRRETHVYLQPRRSWWHKGRMLGLGCPVTVAASSSSKPRPPSAVASDSALACLRGCLPRFHTYFLSACPAFSEKIQFPLERRRIIQEQRIFRRTI